VGILKLTIDNEFSHQRDLSKVADFTGLWFSGLAIGPILSGLLSNPQYKFSQDLDKIALFRNYPYVFPAIVNMFIICTVVAAILIIYPEYHPQKKQYQKMESTLFLQSVLYQSQNEFTKVNTNL
jgi:hypothetical protein